MADMIEDLSFQISQGIPSSTRLHLLIHKHSNEDIWNMSLRIPLSIDESSLEMIFAMKIGGSYQFGFHL